MPRSFSESWPFLSGRTDKQSTLTGYCSVLHRANYVWAGMGSQLLQAKALHFKDDISVCHKSFLFVSHSPLFVSEVNRVGRINGSWNAFLAFCHNQTVQRWYAVFDCDFTCLHSCLLVCSYCCYAIGWQHGPGELCCIEGWSCWNDENSSQGACKVTRTVRELG